MLTSPFLERVQRQIEEKHRQGLEDAAEWLDRHPEARAEVILQEGRTKLTYAINENKPKSVERAYEMITAATERLYVNYFADSSVV